MASPDRFWRPKDFKGSPYAIEKTLSRLAATGELRRIRRGLYWRGASTPLGSAPPSPWSLAEEVAGTSGIGPSATSAAYALGLSTQIPRVETVAIPGRPPSLLPGVRFVGRTSSARRDERLTPLEIALLEVLRDWDHIVEVSHEDALTKIRSFFAKGDIRPHKLARASHEEPARVRERLRELLIELDRPREAAQVPPSHRSRLATPRHSRLTTTRPSFSN